MVLSFELSPSSQYTTAGFMKYVIDYFQIYKMFYIYLLGLTISSIAMHHNSVRVSLYTLTTYISLDIISLVSQLLFEVTTSIVRQIVKPLLQNVTRSLQSPRTLQVPHNALKLAHYAFVRARSAADGRSSCRKTQIIDLQLISRLVSI